MRYMFYHARSFNQPLNNWNVSNVTNMRWMFADAHSFNQPLNKWNVSKVMDMESFFSASCVGGIIGMTLMTRSTRCVIWNKDPDNMAFENFPWTGGVAQIVISWVLSPVASGVCAAALYAVVRYGIFAWENCYLRARVAFPLVVFFTVTVNVTYFIVKGAKGQAEVAAFLQPKLAALLGW